MCTGATAQALTLRLAYAAVHRALLPDRQEAPRHALCLLTHMHAHARTGPKGGLCPGSSPMPSPGERMPPWWGQCVVRAVMGDGEWQPCSQVLLCVDVPAAQDTRQVLGVPGRKLPQGPWPFRASTHPRFAQDPAHHQGPPGAVLTCPPGPPPQRGWAAQPSVGLAPLFCPPPNRCPLGQCQPLFQPLNFTCSQLPQAPLGRALTCAECGALSAAAASEATSNAMLVPPIARARLARPQALPASELHLFVLTFFCHCCHLCHPL